MPIGALRKQVTIQSETSTPDGAGGYTLGWANAATVWAEIRPLSGSENFTAGHLEGHVTHKVTIRYRTDITVTTDMRLMYGARVFNIRAVMNAGEQNHWWELLVEEGAAV